MGIIYTLEQAGFEVLDTDNEKTALDIAANNSIDGAVIDIVLPPSPSELKKPSPDCGLRLGNRLKSDYPDMGLVFLSSYFEFADEVFGMIYQGRRGLAYQHKSNTREQLLNAIHKAMEGDLVIESTLLSDTNPLRSHLLHSLTVEEKEWVEIACANLGKNVLSVRELDVARLLAASRTREGISEALSITGDTVDSHITRVYNKLGIGDLEKISHLRKDVVLSKAFTLHQFQYKGH